MSKTLKWCWEVPFAHAWKPPLCIHTDVSWDGIMGVAWMWRCRQVCFLHASRLAQAVQRCGLNACKLVKTVGRGNGFVRLFLCLKMQIWTMTLGGLAKLGLEVVMVYIYIFVYCIHCFIGMSWFIGDGDASGVPVMLRNILVWLWTFFLSGDSKATPDDARWPCISTALYICWGMNF